MQSFVAVLCGILFVSSLSGETLVLKADKAQSTVSVDVHVTMDSFTAKLDDYSFNAQWDTVAETFTRGSFSFPLSALHTGKAARDEKMLKWEASDKYPVITFSLGSTHKSESGGLVLNGEFNLHGVNKTIDVPVTLVRDGSKFTLTGDATLDYQQFSLPVIRMVIMKVDPVMKVHFTIKGDMVATPAS